MIPFGRRPRRRGASLRTGLLSVAALGVGSVLVRRWMQHKKSSGAFGLRESYASESEWTPSDVVQE